MISLIAAIGQNGAIGLKGQLPWQLPADLKFFKQITMGKPIIMGRKTYTSIGRPLPKRQNIIITRNNNFTDNNDNVHIANSLDQAIKIANDYIVDKKNSEIMVIGGAEIYEIAMPLASRLYLTKVAISPVADAFFPNYNNDEWCEISRKEIKCQDKAIPDFAFITLDHVDNINPR